jgi:hypothetical protein
MAVLLPSPHLKHLKMTPGERQFAARLLAKLENDYHCWYDVPIGRKQLRPDFIVLHPGRGILVLEVKDWKLDTIRQIDSKTVELLTGHGVKHVPNPLEQARAYALEINQLLEVDPLLVEQENPRYKGRLIFPWGYGVVLTNITREQFEQAQLDQAIPGDKVICADEMKERVDPEAFQQHLWGMFNYNFGTVISLARIDRIRWHLFPEIRVSQDGLFPEPTGRAVSTSISEAIPDIVKVMDYEQEKFARNLGIGHRMIHGVAGSGKTLILAYRCIHLSAAGHSKPILVLCFNKSLAAKLSAMLRERGAGDNVHIRHFHGWCKDMCELYQLDLPGKEDGPIYERQVAAVIAGAEKGRVPREQYSGILIDEGHDFEPDWFKLIVQMLDPETDSLLLVYDDVQGIYHRRKPKTWASVGIKVPGRRSTIFKVNYRNTAEALDVAFHFVADYLDESKATEDIPLVRPDTGLRHGNPPTIKKCATLAEELDHIAAWQKELADKSIPFSQMAVLCRYRNQIDLVLAGLAKHGIPAARSDASEKQSASMDRVQVMTMHASKGLEFHCVAIPDLGCMPSRQVEEAEDGRLLYVAMTRATHELLLTFHTESKFSRRLAQQIAENAVVD